ncbi:hypothetical protein [Niveispirillum sp.]|uniref:hypothetical protein n=1 Tax=Niveispirillum sp. TaxID=1917217 RepID=UPI001B72675B|nr:hypothetical protein [Niveispirillum sp.]MBP7335157.1 hypothetical protein [Niveispirillum sp.]
MSGFAVEWRDQKDELGLVLRPMPAEFYRATLIAVADTALVGADKNGTLKMLDTLLSYHGNMPNDPAWITVLGARMMPVRMDAQRPGPVQALLSRCLDKPPPAFGPWWTPTERSVETLANLLGRSVEVLALWPDGGQFPTPLSWQEGPGRQLVKCTSGAAQEWHSILLDRFQGLPAPRHGDSVVIEIRSSLAGRVQVTPPATALGCVLQFHNQGGLLKLPPWGPDLARPLRLATLENGSPADLDILKAATRMSQIG